MTSAIETRREAFQRGYAAALAGEPMAIVWGTGGRIGHSYGMGYFHGRAHR
jgi:hypothetical protein